MMTNKRVSIGQVALNVLLVAFLIIYIFPILWMISSSFKGLKELFSESIYLIPRQPTLEHYNKAISDYALFSWFKNSVGTTVGTSILQILVCFVAAFALGYYKTRLNGPVFYFLLITMVIPFQVTMIPNYILISNMGLMNRWGAVILPNIANATTFFYLYQNVRSLPKAFYEVSQIEGANSFWTMWNVTFELCLGPIAAITILTVIDSWNMYFWPMLVLSKPETSTLTIGLKGFMDFEMGNLWGPFMATATLASLPMILVYSFMQRHIINAFISSGIKG